MKPAPAISPPKGGGVFSFPDPKLSGGGKESERPAQGQTLARNMQRGVSAENGLGSRSPRAKAREWGAAFSSFPWPQHHSCRVVPDQTARAIAETLSAQSKE